MPSLATSATSSRTADADSDANDTSSNCQGHRFDTWVVSEVGTKCYGPCSSIVNPPICSAIVCD